MNENNDSFYAIRVKEVSHLFVSKVYEDTVYRDSIQYAKWFFMNYDAEQYMHRFKLDGEEYEITKIKVSWEYDGTYEYMTALGFTRQSKSMWRKGDVTYQNGKFYRNGKEINYSAEAQKEEK